MSKPIRTSAGLRYSLPPSMRGKIQKEMSHAPKHDLHLAERIVQPDTGTAMRHIRVLQLRDAQEGDGIASSDHTHTVVIRTAQCSVQIANLRATTGVRATNTGAVQANAPFAQQTKRPAHRRRCRCHCCRTRSALIVACQNRPVVREQRNKPAGWAVGMRQASTAPPATTQPVQSNPPNVPRVSALHLLINSLRRVRSCQDTRNPKNDSVRSVHNSRNTGNPFRCPRSENGVLRLTDKSQ
jgi:hypothetical protein